MRITAAVPIIMTLEGAVEQTARPCDLETRLYFEQQLDRGDADLIAIGDLGEEWITSHTHRLVSETGGVFHVTAEIGEARTWPEIALPPNLGLLQAMAEELDRMTRQVQRLMVANGELEAENERLKQHLHG